MVEMLIAGLLGSVTEEAAWKPECVRQAVNGLPSESESQTASFLRAHQQVSEVRSIREERPGFFLFVCFVRLLALQGCL